MVSRIGFKAPKTCIHFENLILKSQDIQICAGCLFWQTHCSGCFNHGIPQERCISTTAHSSQMALNLYSMWQDMEKVFPLRGDSGETCLHNTKVTAGQTTRATDSFK